MIFPILVRRLAAYQRCFSRNARNSLTTPMLFFDTNNFKLWDKALLRHSRIDYIVEFKKCSQHIIKDILLFYFKISEDNKALYDFSKIKDNVWSYSDLDSVVFRHHLNIQECINILSDSENTL